MSVIHWLLLPVTYMLVIGGLYGFIYVSALAVGVVVEAIDEAERRWRKRRETPEAAYEQALRRRQTLLAMEAHVRAQQEAQR